MQITAQADNRPVANPIQNQSKAFNSTGASFFGEGCRGLVPDTPGATRGSVWPPDYLPDSWQDRSGPRFIFSRIAYPMRYPFTYFHPQMIQLVTSGLGTITNPLSLSLLT